MEHSLPPAHYPGRGVLARALGPLPQPSQRTKATTVPRMLFCPCSPTTGKCCPSLAGIAYPTIHSPDQYPRPGDRQFPTPGQGRHVVSAGLHSCSVCFALPSLALLLSESFFFSRVPYGCRFSLSLLELLFPLACLSLAFRSPCQQVVNEEEMRIIPECVSNLVTTLQAGAPVWLFCFFFLSSSFCSGAWWGQS
jgi:hypothetical protein